MGGVSGDLSRQTRPPEQRAMGGWGGEVLTLPLLARESPQSAGSVRLLDFFSSWSPASSMMGSSLVCTQQMERNVEHTQPAAEQKQVDGGVEASAGVD